MMANSHQNVVRGMKWIVTMVLLLLPATSKAQFVVDCNQGQSLNRTLARMDKEGPATVLVKGTCTEYVRVSGFDRLTLKGVQGATLQQPSVDPVDGLAIHVLSVEASRSIIVEGFTVHSRSSALGGIGIGRNSLDIRLRNLTVDGAGVFGVFIFESSQVSLARVTARDPGYATVGVVDVSDVHIEDSLLEHSTGAFWHAGIHVGSGHVTLQRSTIRNMQVGIAIGSGGSVDIQSFNSYHPTTGTNDVVIESPSGTNFFGVFVGSGSLLNVGDTKLRIINPGQPGGGINGGVGVFENSTLNAGANLIISGSQNHGVLVSNNSHASLAGSSITGSGHGGLLAVNMSTIAVGGSNPLTEIAGNAMDLFCDSNSQISGGLNIVNAANVRCSNLLPGDSVALP